VKHRMRTARPMVAVGLLMLMAGCAAPAAGRNLLHRRAPLYALADEPDAPWQEQLVLRREGQVRVRARWTFEAPDTSACAGFVLTTSPEVDRLLLNGEPVPVPVEGMLYREVLGIPPAALRPGANTLVLEWPVRVWARDGRPVPVKAKASARLVPMTPGMFRIQTGPVLGYAGTDFLTVACRTNLPARVTVEADGRRWTGPEGFVHSVEVDGLKAGTAYAYRLVAERPDGQGRVTAGPFQVRTLPGGEVLTFAALGDSRSHPDDWARVAKAVTEARPDFVAFTGDNIADGRRYNLWDEGFFRPAPEFFATLPTFYVLGNHENHSPLFGTLLPVPGIQRWARPVGPVLLVGIDGADQWDAGSENLRWLEGVLKAAEEPYIFLLTHYPAWSSGPHGGRNERPILQGRRFILPLMKRYGATAMLSGHDHCYERSEPPDGVTVIITGGAGAPLYGKAKDAEKHNPHSQVYARKHHYCLFTVTPEACTMRALTPAGEEIDTRRWPPRRGP